VVKVDQYETESKSQKPQRVSGFSAELVAPFSSLASDFDAIW